METSKEIKKYKMIVSSILKIKSIEGIEMEVRFLLERTISVKINRLFKSQ